MATDEPFNSGGPRHSIHWYDQSTELHELQLGAQLFIRCDGGPCASRLETFPPRLEIEQDSGIYVLVDDGRRDGWRYVFQPRRLVRRWCLIRWPTL